VSTAVLSRPPVLALALTLALLAVLHLAGGAAALVVVAALGAAWLTLATTTSGGM